ERCRRGGRREERDPRRHFKPRHGLADGGGVRHGRGAGFFHDRHDLDLAAPEMRNRGRETEEGDLYMPTQQIVDGGAAAAIRHVDDVGFLAQEFAGEMMGEPMPEEPYCSWPGCALA